VKVGTATESFSETPSQSRMVLALRHFASDYAGVTVIEYGLIAILIASAILALMSIYSSGIETLFGELAAALKL